MKFLVGDRGPELILPPADVMSFGPLEWTPERQALLDAFRDEGDE